MEQITRWYRYFIINYHTMCNRAVAGVKAMKKYANSITRWDLLFNSCVGHTTRALWRAGIPTIYAFHPYMLNLQLTIRQIGIYSSPYLYQIP